MPKSLHFPIWPAPFSTAWRRLASMAALASFLGVATAGGAFAQNVSNEAWVGQTGGTNTITIIQVGRDNKAGANTINQQINQNGDLNQLAIDQFGWSNEVGATVFDALPMGVDQVGDRNEIDIVQRNEQEGGSNIVGAIFQQSSLALPGADVTNRLQIVQNQVGGLDLAAGHSVATVIQIYTGDGSQAGNITAITQTGGGFGNGNEIGLLRQEGYANVTEILQAGQAHRISNAWQIGVANSSFILQEGGDRNLVEYSLQYGVGNVSQVQMSGSRNAVERILQNNQYQTVVGNRAQITLVGEGNGGTGVGDVSEFISEATLAVGAAQANIVQLGDDNDVRITIAGNDNRFGVHQYGEGNGAIIAIGEIDGQFAHRNESAVFQDGDDNNMSHLAVGSDNVAAVIQDGHRNRIAIEQRGDGNLADARMDGSDNNATTSVFSGAAALVSSLFGSNLQPGTIYQQGNDNRAIARVTGNGNSFGFHQVGNDNRIEGTINGTQSQLAVAQAGNMNVSLSQQTGVGNSLGVRQF